MRLLLREPRKLSGSVPVTDRGSKKTLEASSKETLCFRRFANGLLIIKYKATQASFRPSDTRLSAIVRLAIVAAVCDVTEADSRIAMIECLEIGLANSSRGTKPFRVRNLCRRRHSPSGRRPKVRWWANLRSYRNTLSNAIEERNRGPHIADLYEL